MTAGAPATIGRYTIEAEVGRGTMGIVYRAKDTLLARTVALKTVGAFGAAAEDAAGFERRFLNEARAAAGLSHPNIVAVHDFGSDPATGTLFMALEFLPGETLEAVARRGPMEWAQAFRQSPAWRGPPRAPLLVDRHRSKGPTSSSAVGAKGWFGLAKFRLPT